MAETGKEAAGKARFRCLRCGAEFELDYTPGKVEERACPACESNSVRRLKPSAGHDPIPSAESGSCPKRT